MIEATLLRGRYVLVFGVCTLLLFVFSVPAGHAGTIMIDSFDNPQDPSDPCLLLVPGESPREDGNPSAMENSFLEILRGERDVFVKAHGTPLSISASVVAGYEPSYDKGILAFATYGFSNFGSASHLVLQYDGYDDDESKIAWPILTNSEQLNTYLTDGGTNDAFVFDFISLDAGSDRTSLDLRITVNGPDGRWAVYKGTIPETHEAFQHRVEFTDVGWEIIGVAPFDAATSVTFTFNDPDAAVMNVDFELDSISTVPEPSTLVMLALGCLIGAGVRRFRRK